MSSVHHTSLHSLPLVSRGKVRDIYAVGDDRLLIVTTDRLSAFDVVLDEPIPDKGRVLNRMALFWFDRLADVVPNHLTGIDPESVVQPDERAQVRGRSMVVKRLRPILVEAVVRGYLIGSGWKDYQASGAVCGITLPAGLRLADRLPQPVFTPAAKAALGEHDENITFDEMVARIGAPLAEQIRAISLELYRRAADLAAARGIIVADTKFEFGCDDRGVLHLMDEVLTADSSRFWPAAQWRVGESPPSFDKQYVRDWLDRVPGWDRKPPAPRLPAEVIEQTAARYREALRRITGEELPDDDDADAPAATATAQIGIVMGSGSDWEVMQHAAAIVREFGVPCELRVLSAHRMPDEMFAWAAGARARGLRAIIAGAGGAAHLPGMLAAKTIVPVLGVPVPSKYLRGEDSLLSIVQMPRGVPVATFAIGEAGAANAALFALAQLAVDDPALAARLQAFRDRQSAAARATTLPPPG